MRVVIVGCGRFGSELATRLYEKGHEVSIIDHVPAAFTNLPPAFEGRIIEGEALSDDVLHRAGIEKADALAAVTNQDALNAVAAHIARTVYDVPVVVVRNYDPYCRSMHEAFELQVVSSSSWGAQRMEELIYHGEIRTIFSAGNGEVEIYEITVPKSWQGRRMHQLMEHGQSLAIALTRAGRAVLPDDDMALLPGDVVTISATFEGIEAIRSKVNRH